MFKILSVDYYKRKNIKDVYSIKDDIDFNPEYQRRGDVWKKPQKQLLIDSIINQFDIPKFYFHELSNNEINNSNKNYAIIDGKQRLMSIIEFIEGRYKLADNFIYFNDENIKLNGLTFDEIKFKYPDIAFSFFEFKLDIVYIITNNKQLIECFFSRLNSGQPLVNSEKRNAKSGYVKSWIDDTLCNNNFFNKKVNFKNSRSSYNDILAKFILIELNNKFINMGRVNLDKLYDQFRESNVEIEKATSEVIYTLNTMSFIFEDNDELLSVRSSLPVYYKVIRDIDSNDLNIIREFLYSFDKNRKKKDIDDPKIIKYNLYQSKSTEQKISMENRYNILMEEFTEYIRIRKDGL